MKYVSIWFIVTIYYTSLVCFFFNFLSEVTRQYYFVRGSGPADNDVTIVVEAAFQWHNTHTHRHTGYTRPRYTALTQIPTVFIILLFIVSCLYFLFSLFFFGGG